MILLTGMTGKSGKWFLKNLIDKKNNHKNQNYRVIVRTTSNVDLIDICGLSIEKAYGDLNDVAFLDKAMKNVTTVFHVAGIHTSLKVVQAAAENNVKWQYRSAHILQYELMSKYFLKKWDTYKKNGTFTSIPVI